MTKSASTADQIAREISDQCLGMRARKVHRDLTRIFDSELSDLGLTGPQMTLLAAIQIMEPVASGALGNELGLEKSTVSRNLRLMEENGWLKQTTEQTRRLISLSPAGRRLLQKALPSWRRAQALARQTLGEQLAQVLGQVPPTAS